MKTAKQILEQTKHTLLTKGWCQSRLAKDDKGDEVSIWDAKACRFCLVGAMRISGARECSLSSMGAEENTAGDLVIDVLAELYPHTLMTMARFNDGCADSVNDVIAVIDLAIERAV